MPMDGARRARFERLVGSAASCGLWFAGLALFCAQAVATSIDDCAKHDWAPAAVADCAAKFSDPKTDVLERGRIYTLRGVAWLNDEEPIAAISDFTRAIALDATNISALRGRAQAYSAIKKNDLSLADWSAIIALRPEVEEYYRARAAVHLAAGHHEHALSDYAKALELDAGNVAAFVGRASVHDAMGHRELALKDFSEALKINPAYIPAYWERGLMAERWGDKKLAIESYQTLLKHDDNYWDAQKALQQHGIYRW
jgi:tetratricopeptide (TPR) repeat protein